MSPEDFSPTVFVARKPRRFDWRRPRQICIQRIAEEKQSRSDLDGTMNHKSPTNEEIRIYEQHSLENSFRKNFSKVENQLDEALARKDPNEFWRMWSEATEDGIIDVCEYCQTERKQFTGHGIARYPLRRHKAPQVFQDHQGHAAFFHQSH